MKRILLLVIVLILYGSFYPWQFQPRHLTASPLWILLHSWPSVLDRFAARDIAINIALYIPLGAFCFLSMKESRSRLWRTALTLFTAATLSASIEMTQLFDVSRICSLLDLLCNVIGASIGILLAAAFPSAISTAIQGAEAAGVLRLSGVMALLYLWIGYQIFPAIPAISRTVLRSKIVHLLGRGTWPARDFFESLAGWLAASALLEFLVGARRFQFAISLAVLLIPLKLFIADRTITASELAGALLAIAGWLILRRIPRPARVAGLLTLGAIVAAGLVPFHWLAIPQPFTWIPFLPMLRSPWEIAFLILLEKCFLYGAAIWLLRERSWFLPTAIVAIPLAAVEIIQLHLPGRTAEITDPLLALLLGLSLMLLERHARQPVK